VEIAAFFRQQAKRPAKGQVGRLLASTVAKETLFLLSSSFNG